MRGYIWQEWIQHSSREAGLHINIFSAVLGSQSTAVQSLPQVSTASEVKVQL